MTRCSLMLALLLLFPVCAGAADKVFVPVPVADRIESIEATETDIGAPDKLFDLDEHSIMRTPSINPAYVQVQFAEPIHVEHLRIHFNAGAHRWSLAAADSVADLERKAGSYRLVVDERETKGDIADVAIDEPFAARVFRLDALRLTGDDYVHIAEWQFCEPGTIDELVIRRITDRRAPHEEKNRVEVTGPVEEPIKTVVWFQANARANGRELEIDELVAWSARSPGLETFGAENGMFLIKDVGEHEVVARYGDFEQRFTLVGTPRTMKNREDDVEILLIERLPRIPYDGPDDGWPVEGSRVTWRGHLYNWGRHPVRVRYEWKLNSKVLDTGEIDLPVGPPDTEATYVDLPWSWNAARHDLTLHVEPTGGYRDLVPANNTLTIQTDAITVGLWVEQSLWEHHHEYQYWLPTQDANSFAGWGQRMMRQWNKMFRAAVYPEYPNGVEERVRLDRVVVVPDFALPLNGGLPSNNPDTRDKTVDMTWGCEAGDIKPGFDMPADHWWSPVRALKAFARGNVQSGKVDPPFWCGLGYIHEMAHARYLIDAYGFNVHTGHGEDISQRMFQLTADGQPVLGRYMPLENDIQYWRKYKGQMGGDYWSWSVFEAMCWNRVRGRRAQGGNCNGPPNIGEFLQDIPKEVVYAYVDPAGKPLANADVRVYRARGTGSNWYTKKFVDEPDIRAATDERGRVTFDRTLWSADGKIRHTYGHSNAVVCIRLSHNGQHYFLFEEVTDANIAYNLGYRERYVFPRLVRTRTGEPSPDEWNVDEKWQPPGTGFGLR